MNVSILNVFVSLAGEGYLSIGELRHIMINLAARLSEEQVDELLTKADIHVDSLVNYEGKK